MTDTIRIRLAILALIVFVLLTTATIGVINGTGNRDTSVSVVESPGIESLITYAELVDLQAVAIQFDISLQDAIDQYAWRNDFAALVAELRSNGP